MSTCLEDSCSICFNVYNDSDHQAVALPCSHSFCVTCLTQLRSSDSHTCPVCREDWKHLQLKVNVKTEMVGTCASSDCTPAVDQLDAKSDGQDCDFKTGVNKEVNNLCLDHSLPFWFWCDECKEFSCRKCVAKKQKTCTLFDIEEMLPNIKCYFNSQIEMIVSEVQNNTDNLNTALTHATDMLSSVTKHIDVLLKRQHNLTAHVKLLEQMVCKRQQDITTVKKYCSVIKKIEKVTDIPVFQKSLKALNELRQHDVPPIPSSPIALESDATCMYMAQAEHSAGSSTDAATAEAAALLEEGGDWTVDANNWRAAVLALAERQPKLLILRAARDGVPETLKADTVATIAGAARDCEVSMFLLDTFYSPYDHNTDRQRLEHVLANKSLRLTEFFGHLDAAGIARLPRSVGRLGLAIGSAGDAASVSGVDVWGELGGIEVAVSTSVAPQHLRPLPCVSLLRVHFYGISDGQVDLIRPAVDALVTYKSRWVYHLCLPKCQLSAGGAQRLAHQLRGAEIGSVAIDLSGSWRPGEEERQSVTEAFSSALKCGVKWDMEWLFGEK